MKTVDVLLTGQVVTGADARASAAGLARLAGIDHQAALRILTCGRLIRIKKGANAAVGLQYFRALSAIGVEVVLRPSGLSPADQTAFPAGQMSNQVHARARSEKKPEQTRAQALASSPGVAKQPRLGPGYAVQRAVPLTPMAYPQTRPQGLLEQIRMAGQALSTRFSTFPPRPGRKEAIALPHGPKLRRSEDWLSAPRLVAASQGWEWLRQSWFLFTEQLGLWLLCFALCCALLGLLFWIPAVHIFVMVMVLPILLGALMLVAHRQHQEEPLGSLRPLAATLQLGQRLLLLGFFSLLFLLFLGAACFIALDFGLFNPSLFTAPTLQMPAARQVLLWAAGIVLFALILLLLAGYFFAIPLVLFTHLRPLRSFQMGMYGCVRNWRAMLVALTITASALCSFTALLFALQHFLPMLPYFVSLFLIAALLPFVVAVGTLSIYYAFRDMFAIVP